jgi:heme-degrading monooxygenase HmoA/quinol monooxygenase YgiN
MAITEIALLHLSPNVTIQSPDLRLALSNAKTVMQSYTSRTFYYFQQVEDPTYIYIFGEWDSLDQHMNQFIPGAENQALLQTLKDLLTVEWLLHIDASHAELPLPASLPADQKQVTLSVVRHFIKEGEKNEFQQTFETNKHYLQNYTTQGKLGGGWRVDGTDGKEEWVLLTPWENVEQHYGFAQTEGFTEYGRIRDHINGAEIKHATVLDI